MCCCMFFFVVAARAIIMNHHERWMIMHHHHHGAGSLSSSAPAPIRRTQMQHIAFPYRQNLWLLAHLFCRMRRLVSYDCFCSPPPREARIFILLMYDTSIIFWEQSEPHECTHYLIFTNFHVNRNFLPISAIRWMRWVFCDGQLSLALPVFMVPSSLW